MLHNEVMPVLGQFFLVNTAHDDSIQSQIFSFQILSILANFNYHCKAFFFRHCITVGILTICTQYEIGHSFSSFNKTPPTATLKASTIISMFLQNLPVKGETTENILDKQM